MKNPSEFINLNKMTVGDPQNPETATFRRVEIKKIEDAISGRSASFIKVIEKIKKELKPEEMSQEDFEKFKNLLSHFDGDLYEAGAKMCRDSGVDFDKIDSK